MANGPKQITITFTAAQLEEIETISKLTGDDLTNVLRKAITELHTKVMADENGKQIAQINSMLDVQ
jgi:hypothetical protein